MNTIKIKETILQPGRPKVAVPLVGTVPEKIVEECYNTVSLPCDIIEWRADYYLAAKENLDSQLREKDIYIELMKILDDINYIAGNKPVIFTLRRKSQGGEVQITKEQAGSIWNLVARSRLADIIDVELFDENDNFDEAELVRQVNEIHACGSKVIISYHDFDAMPKPMEIVNLTKAMGRTGADIYKIAAMAYSKEEAENLIKATAFLNKNGIGPLIMLAMGEWGKSARVAAGKYGSCMTFASGVHQSAPGQVDSSTLKKWLDDYYGEEKPE